MFVKFIDSRAVLCSAILSMIITSRVWYWHVFRLSAVQVELLSFFIKHIHVWLFLISHSLLLIVKIMEIEVVKSEFLSRETY